MSFRFTTAIQVRYRDLDTLQHVNNAVYSTYLEQARAEYLQQVPGFDVADGEMVIVHLSMDFQNSLVQADGQAVVGVRVDAIGESSFEMRYEVRAGSDDRVCLRARSTQVAMDEGSSRPVPDEWRAAIEAYEPDL